MKFIRQAMTLVAVALLAGLFVVPAVAQKKKSRTQDAARHAGEAAEAFTQIMNVRDKAIPKELLDKAEGIAVFPSLVARFFCPHIGSGLGCGLRFLRRPELQ